MEVTVLYIDGCPNWQTADERLRALADELGFTLRRRRIDRREDAARFGFAGSPTILVGGVDPFARGDEPTALACRVYVTPDGRRVGCPTTTQLRAALA